MKCCDQPGYISNQQMGSNNVSRKNDVIHWSTKNTPTIANLKHLLTTSDFDDVRTKFFAKKFQNSVLYYG